MKKCAAARFCAESVTNGLYATQPELAPGVNVVPKRARGTPIKASKVGSSRLNGVWPPSRFERHVGAPPGPATESSAA